MKFEDGFDFDYQLWPDFLILDQVYWLPLLNLYDCYILQACYFNFELLA